jgi:hypothetical protein
MDSDKPDAASQRTDKLPNLSAKYSIIDPDSVEIAEIAKLLTRGPIETLEHLEQVEKIEDKDTLRRNAEHMSSVMDQESKLLRTSIDQKIAQKPIEEQSRQQLILDAIDAGDESGMLQNGLSFEYAWMNDVVATILKGNPPVEIETVGPYAAAHINPETDKLEIDPLNVPDDEMAGILVAAILRKIDPVAHNTRIVSLMDELNNFTSERQLTKEEQDEYIAAMAEFYLEIGVLKPDDEAGKDFVILRESDLADKVQMLEVELNSSGQGEIKKNDAGETYFMPSEDLVDSLALHTGKTIKELKTDGILLRRKDGSPTCQAMDAAGFLNPINEKYMHVVMLEERMESQQDKTYALLKALGVVKQERYHNILFDSEGLSPELVTYGVVKTLERHTIAFLKALDKYDEWKNFDPFEYVQRNYGTKILEEDEQIIRTVIASLMESGIEKGSITDAADIGSGPNLYPSMLMAPYLSDNAKIDMLEYAESNREYMQQLIKGELDDDHNATWHKFEHLMIECGGEEYRGAEEKAKRAAEVKPGNIFTLPEAAFDMISSYFVAESIVDSNMPFREGMQSLARALRANGVMIIAHMVGSEGYYAGEGTHFPAVNLSIKDLEEAYADAGLDYKIVPIGEDAHEKAREGYHGMAVVIASPKRA